MKEKFKLYGSIFILIIFVPCLLMLWVRGGFGGKQADPVQQQIEDALPFVVAKEISVNSKTETLKAQAVIARTNFWRIYLENQSDAVQSNETQLDQNETKDNQTETSSTSDADKGSLIGNENESGSEEKSVQKEWNLSDSGVERYTESELKALWGTSAYEKHMEKLRQAVEETRGEILTVEDQPIQAAYHYAANCRTRNASEVPGQESAGYLQSVDSLDDMQADGFLSISYMEKQEMADALAPLFQEDAPLAENLPGALELTTRDSAGYVTEVTCGRTVANGEAMRQALHLNSACFYFSELDGKIRIVTKGIGHGLGLSQYGANELAKQGKNYQEILKYYYTDVTLEHWK